MGILQFSAAASHCGCPKGLVTPWKASSNSRQSIHSPKTSPALTVIARPASAGAVLSPAAHHPPSSSCMLTLTSWKEDAKENTDFIPLPPRTCGTGSGISRALRKEINAYKEKKKFQLMIKKPKPQKATRGMSWVWGSGWGDQSTLCQ